MNEYYDFTYNFIRWCFQKFNALKCNCRFFLLLTLINFFYLFSICDQITAEGGLGLLERERRHQKRSLRCVVGRNIVLYATKYLHFKHPEQLETTKQPLTKRSLCLFLKSFLKVWLLWFLVPFIDMIGEVNWKRKCFLLLFLLRCVCMPIVVLPPTKVFFVAITTHTSWS